MIKKIILRLLFLVLPAFLLCPSGRNLVINKILYQKTLLNYYQPVLLNLYFNPMEIKEVIVIFNDEEIPNIITNFTSQTSNNETFFPSISFEVNNIKNENTLQLFVVLSQGLTVSAKTKVEFKKGIIVDNNDISLSTKKVFFIKAGPLDEGIDYSAEIDGTGKIKQLTNTVYENILYFKFVSIGEGSDIIKIYKYDESIEVHQVLPQRIVKVSIH